jgi:peptide/nickel transport system substrate-binding protein
MDRFGTDYASMNEDAEFNLNPTVTAGPFSFRNFRPGEQVTVVADQNFPDSQQGFVVPEGWVYKNLENQTVVMESFLAKEIDMITSVPADRREEARERAANGEFQIFEGPSSGWQFLAFNTADPTNPQNAFDEDGNPIDQGHHPIFGDKRVRQAVLFGTDYNELNEKAFFGTGIAVYSPFLTYSWAFNDQIAPRPYDPDQAMSLLEEAGWTDEDGDGIRECHGCMYAEEGAPLSWELLSFTGNTSVDATVVLMKDQLAKIGMDVQLNITEFQTMLDLMDTQTIDSVMLFLGSLDPNNPDELRDVFTPEGDVIGSGFNWGSYNNPEVTALFEEGRKVPGCSIEDRTPIYYQIQELMNEDVPWFFINTTIVPVVAQGNIENWSPTPGSVRWNLDEWFKS